MSRDSKLGYGFMIAGVGLSAVITAVFVAKVAVLTVGILLIICGGGFLIAAYCHKTQTLEPRLLSPKNIVTLHKALMEYWFRKRVEGNLQTLSSISEHHPYETVTIQSLSNDHEATAFMQQLVGLFRQEGWSVTYGEMSLSGWSRWSVSAPTGIVMLSRNRDYKTTALRALFDEMGFVPKVDYQPLQFNDLKDTTIFIGRNVSN